MSTELADITKKLEEIQKNTHEQRKAHEKDMEEKGRLLAETQEKLAKIEADTVEKEKAHEEYCKKLEAKLARSSAPVIKGLDGRELTQDAVEYKKALRQYMQKGDASKLEELQTKTLSVQSDPDGGYTVAEDTSGRIVSRIFETSELLQYVNRQNISTDSLSGITDQDEVDAKYVGETDNREGGETPKIGKWKIDTHEIYTEPTTTQKVLDDSSINLEAWLANKVAMRFMRRIQRDIVRGSSDAGVNVGIKGIYDYADVDPETFSQNKIGTLNSAAANDLTWDDMIKLQGSLKYGYDVNARWALARPTRTHFRLLKDGESRYYWEDSVQAGEPARMLGKEIITAEDLDKFDFAGDEFADNTLPVLYGDFNEAYQFVDRMGIRVIRDNVTRKGFIKFFTTIRVGGDVINTDAIKRLRVTAA